MHSIVGRPASAASIAAGLLRFWGFLFPAVAVPFLTWHVSLPWMGKPYDLAFSWAQPLAVVAIAVITFINYLGVRLRGPARVGPSPRKSGPRTCAPSPPPHQLLHTLTQSQTPP